MSDRTPADAPNFTLLYRQAGTDTTAAGSGKAAGAKKGAKRKAAGAAARETLLGIVLNKTSDIGERSDTGTHCMSCSYAAEDRQLCLTARAVDIG